MPKKDPSPVTLEKLLQLKRAEQPSPEFWDSFDKALHTRRLQKLVERPSPWAVWARSLRRAVYVLAPTAAAAYLAFFVLADPGRTGDAPAAAAAASPMAAELEFAPASALEFAMASARENVVSAEAFSGDSPARNRFVDETISMSSERTHYRKVLYTPSIHSVARDGAVHYVAEPIAEAASRVGTASSARMRHF
ncbi:MAG: hypothetical protein JJU00_10070 [Opitutales bacterium]|nr:hypothetical protein [Opitutales bacterium]